MNYDFRKELLTVHESNVRCAERLKKENEIEIKNGDYIWISDKSNDVMEIGVKDYIDFLKTSMNVSVELTNDKENAILTVELASEAGVELGEYATQRGFKIITDENKIKVYGYDDRGVTQALYYMEDLMCFEKSPVMGYGEIVKKPAFTPQMVHSAYGFDEFPDEYLMRVAHEGRDAILVYTKGLNESKIGYLDFNELVERARKCGLDVYAYSVISSKYHPDDPEAEEYYESTYGRLFKECPGLKGVTLVGESVEFPTKDPNASPLPRLQNIIDGIPTGKTSSGWYPCYDYPDWINFIKKIIRKYKADADIVFWTYNMGRRPSELRIKLVESLPTDITLLANFETTEQMSNVDAVARVADYSLSFAGPGRTINVEGAVAKKRGLKLYSMTNTGGRTWDFGVVPYEPMPYQWIVRYKNMLKAQEEWGLCGIMESHHYGFYPSFISKLSKHCLMLPKVNMEDMLKKILISEFGEENYNEINSSLESLSEAITYYTATNADQYGAFRVGPAYPFNLVSDIPMLTDEGAMYGGRICDTKFKNWTDYASWLLPLRLKPELKSQEKMFELMEKAVETLETTKDRNEKLEKLVNLVKFMRNTALSGLNAKKWHLMTYRMMVEDDRDSMLRLFDEMEVLLKEELKNVEATFPLVEYDSSLGWEPSMLYMTDKRHLEWKIRQIDYVLNSEIRLFRLGASLNKGEDYTEC